ncbi:hypothetical protein GOBAR_AA08174 [Gossypium barbadense]|uniref:Protein kinase domain-containing protein n=1 Tax=Gossypium barbadense TaxID=3634 RepID=A0A2P5YA61_GOSBA|nr:hypothetical protein GOBAR_AA08174 [Gossypium barbadense]
MRKKLASVLILCLVTVVFSTTDSGDLDVLMQFRDELDNPELLKWPENGGDPCGPPSWNHIYCENSRVTQIQAQGMGLKGTLPKNLNKLSMLKNIGLQRNQLSGKLPSFSGLSNLRYAYLDYNNFDSIPSDFLDGLDNLEVLALDDNNFNASTGWSFPKALENSAQLTNLSCMNCNLIGPLPDFLGSMPSLTNLMLSGNRLSGEIQGTFNGSALQTLWLNNQLHGGMTGPIDVVATMESLTVLWLHGNHFTGTIPESIGKLTLLKDLNLNSNKLVGLIPISLANMRLQNLDLNNNHLMGPIPMFKASKVTFASNKFCQATQGLLCSPAVMALIEFLGGVNYPSKLVSSWSGNEPCNWLGIRCNSGKVSVINLPHYNLSGSLSPSVAKLDTLSQIRLQSNNLSGPIPNNWTSLKSLETLDLSGNNISGPLPKFSRTVKLVVTGNPLLNGDKTDHTKGANIPPESSDSPPNIPTTSSQDSDPGSPATNSSLKSTKTKGFKRNTFVLIMAPVASFALVAFLVIPLSIYFYKKRKDSNLSSTSLVIPPRDPSDPDNMVKVVVAANNTNGNTSTLTGSGSASRNSSSIGESHVIEAGNLVISVQVLRNVTKNFAAQKELGRGGFGVVYKGELDDGTQIAVKRMEAGVITNKALDEFQAEIAVLSKKDFNGTTERRKRLESVVRLSSKPNTEANSVLAAIDATCLARNACASEIGRFTGKITTKADVFSFGVVLMELLTGLTALDEDRPEETQYLAAWFWHIKPDKEKLRAAINPSLDVKDETFESVSIIAELAGHCTAREPSQRPDMGHAVNVLAPLVEKWKPLDDDNDDYCAIDYSLPLNQMVKDWQEAEGKDFSYLDLEDSKGSIPARPTGFAESFTSADGR